MDCINTYPGDITQRTFKMWILSHRHDVVHYVYGTSSSLTFLVVQVRDGGKGSRLRPLKWTVYQ